MIGLTAKIVPLSGEPLVVGRHGKFTFGIVPGNLQRGSVPSVDLLPFMETALHMQCSFVKSLFLVVRSTTIPGYSESGCNVVRHSDPRTVEREMRDIPTKQP